MAYQQVVLLLALVLTISSTSASTSRRLLHNDVIFDTDPDKNRVPEVDVAGFVQCFIPPKEPVTKPLVAGLDVVVVCDGGRTVVGEAVTNTNGFFQITANTVKSIVSGQDTPSSCKAVLRTPIAGCRVVPPTGVLQGTDLPIHVDELLGHGHEHDNIVPQDNVTPYESNLHVGREAYNYVGHQYQP